METLQTKGQIILTDLSLDIRGSFSRDIESLLAHIALQSIDRRNFRHRVFIPYIQSTNQPSKLEEGLHKCEERFRNQNGSAPETERLIGKVLIAQGVNYDTRSRFEAF